MYTQANEVVIVTAVRVTLTLKRSCVHLCLTNRHSSSWQTPHKEGATLLQNKTTDHVVVY
jgi:hypothetical protein